MTDQNLLFDVRTRSGIEFPEMRLDQLQGLVNDGTLQGDDMVMVCGDKRQRWFPLSRLEGLKVSAVGGQWQDDAAPPAPSSGGSTLLLASLGGVFVVLLLTVAVIAYVRFSGSGDPPVMEVVVEDTQGSESASATPGNPSRFEASVAEITTLIDRATAARDEGRFDDADVDIKQALALIERYDLILDTERIPLEARLDVLGETIDEARAAAAVAAAVPDEVNISDWYDRHHRAVPVMLALMPDGRLGHGSGFLIREGNRLYLVTNRHVIDGSSTAGEPVSPAPARMMAWFFSKDAKGLMVNVHSIELPPSDFRVHSGGIDVAISDVTSMESDFDAQGIVPLELDRAMLPPAADLFWVGHPGAARWQKDANETWEHAFQRYMDLLQITTDQLSTRKEVELWYGDRHWPPVLCTQLIVRKPINRGNSGGPMLSQASGGVVGVCSYSSTHSIAYGAVDAVHILETINGGKRWDPVTMGPNSIELVEPEEPDFHFMANDCDLELPFLHEVLKPEMFSELLERKLWIDGDQDAALLYCHLVRSVRSTGEPVTFVLDLELTDRGFDLKKLDQIYILVIPYRIGSDIDLELQDASGRRIRQPKSHGPIGEKIVRTKASDDGAEPFALGYGMRRRTTSHVKIFSIKNKGEETTDVLLLIYGRSLD